MPSLPSGGCRRTSAYVEGMGSLVLDHFSAIFGNRRGLSARLCRELMASRGSLLKALVPKGVTPGDGLLIAGRTASGKSTVCHSLLAEALDEGKRCCLLHNVLKPGAPDPWEEVAWQTQREHDDLEDLLFTSTSTSLYELREMASDFDLICIDSLGGLRKATEDSFGDIVGVPFLMEAVKNCAEDNNALLVVTRRTLQSDGAWRQDLRKSGLYDLCEHLGLLQDLGTGEGWEWSLESPNGLMPPVRLRPDPCDPEARAVRP